MNKTQPKSVNPPKENSSSCYLQTMVGLHLGDCLDVMKTFPDNCVDSIVTDPPYGISFMGKHWDYDVPTVEIWQECLRILKPGGFLLSFAGTRTQHRMAVNIEGAGFEIRDMIAWVYGSGFPKSLNIGKAVDALLGNDREIVGTRNPHLDGSKRINTSAPQFTTLAGNKRKQSKMIDGMIPVYKGNSQWEGWGTALKPAFEPIVVARKPLQESTVAKNVLKYGTGGINIDGCRVGAGVDYYEQEGKSSSGKSNIFGQASRLIPQIKNQQGRFPANFIHDGSEEVVSLFPESEVSGSAKLMKAHTGGHKTGFCVLPQTNNLSPNDSGSAARFFYTAKASKSERGLGNNHPTVKPLSLMRYLCRLVTSLGGIVCDPFMGSGTTGMAAKAEGFKFVGIELEKESFEIAQARIENHKPQMELL
uniref:Putative methyltransferase n=1 Tax=viral metagenome TaxID=1070528 RepID=A0A6M3LN06_9ZZZZ